MPELPDIEIYRRDIQRKAVDKKISNINVIDRRLVKGSTIRTFKEELTGRKFTSTLRVGKNLFITVNDKLHLLLHFGMTGDVKIYKEREPDYARVIFDLDSGEHFAVISKRMLGKVQIVNDIDDYLKKEEIGPDAYRISEKDFIGATGNGRGMIKTFFMNQAHIAGLGNIYVDELLFQSKIHPEKQIDKLDEKTLKHVYDKMKHILKTAIEKRANPENFPASWIIPKRDEGKSCPKCKGKIKKIKVSQRGTYFCPKCQKK